MVLRFLLFLFLCPFVFAGRPLYTDDSSVIGRQKYQIESWMYGDEHSLQHWIVPTVGLGNDFEFSASGVHGYSFQGDKNKMYAYSGPILQGKFRVHDFGVDRWPGLAFAAGTIPPFGKGTFKPPTWEYFYYAATTSRFFGHERTLLHLNLGRQTRRQLKNQSPLILWAAAIELRTTQKCYWFVEASNGEVYSLIPGIASQTGFRYDVSPDLQIDGTIGRGVNGTPRLPFWATVGFKYLWDYKFLSL